jgi:predicted nicotinamide N-methyase/predicted Fe-Mo cluster-binding NifX family protein
MKGTLGWDFEDLDWLEQQVACPSKICELRAHLLSNELEETGFAGLFVPLLHDAVESWFSSLRHVDEDLQCEEKKDENETMEKAKSINLVFDPFHSSVLRRTLSMHKMISQCDPVLAEEIGHQGSHMLLSRLIRHEITEYREEVQDVIMEIQDLACDIASQSPSFPLKMAPMSRLRERLPISISFSDNDYQIWIQQVTSRQSAQQDVGFVLWPSAVALAQWILDNPRIITDVSSILELGAGCGLVGLVAAKLSQSNARSNVENSTTLDDRQIIITDFNPVVLDNIRHNIRLNGVQAVAQRLDFYEQSGTSDHWISGPSDGQIALMHNEIYQDQVELILAADIICQEDDAFAAANSIHDVLRSGGKAIIVCASGNHRFGVDAFEGACLGVGLDVHVSSMEVNLESLKLTAGYVEGMSLKMFKIFKL